MQERLSEGDPLPVALREVADGSTTHVFESKTLECFFNGRSAVGSRKPPEPCHESEEAIDTQLNVQSRRLRYVPQARLNGLGMSAG